jgi:aspartate/tyrosine/aromatic aminotransferase
MGTDSKDTGFNHEQVKRLAEDDGVFPIGHGRITIPIVNGRHIEHVANVLAEAARMREQGEKIY